MPCGRSSGGIEGPSCSVAPIGAYRLWPGLHFGLMVGVGDYSSGRMPVDWVSRV